MVRQKNCTAPAVRLYSRKYLIICSRALAKAPESSAVGAGSSCGLAWRGAAGIARAHRAPQRLLSLPPGFEVLSHNAETEVSIKASEVLERFAGLSLSQIVNILGEKIKSPFLGNWLPFQACGTNSVGTVCEHGHTVKLFKVNMCWLVDDRNFSSTVTSEKCKDFCLS